MQGCTTIDRALACSINGAERKPHFRFAQGKIPEMEFSLSKQSKIRAFAKG